jgi:AraC-like DNA-binding protein
MHETILTDRHFEDLNPVLFGRMKFAPGHRNSPVVRDYVLIQYVESGRGILYIDNTAYPVNEGQAFIITKGKQASYVADKDTPWICRWIAFNGKLSNKYNSLPPVVNINGSLFPNLEECGDGVVEYVLASQLFRMTAELFAEDKYSNRYVRRVKDFIKINYMSEIHVEQIAKELSLDRRYLSRVFKKETGKTIQQYLVETRMKHACDFLKAGKSVSECVALCGYSDLPNFSRMFKRTYGVSPTAFQKGGFTHNAKN